MNVERLMLLRHVAERGSIAAAAASSSLTPSAVSQQLKLLARETGVVLLERRGRGVRLTDAGYALVECADDVLAALDRAQAEMDAYRETPRGKVRVALFPTGAAMFLPQLLARTAQVGVAVDGRDIDEPASHAPALLADFDVVVVHRDERDSAPWGPRYEAVTLMREPLEVVLPPGHRLARAQRIALAELAEEPWIGVRDGLMVDDVLRSLATVAGVTPQVCQRVDDFRVTEELVWAGFGVALMPRYVRTVRPLPRKSLTGIRVARRIEAVSRTGARSRPAVDAVIGILEDIATSISMSAH
ncbi:DNA-binding transcriptional LysR family regulator [Mycobacterium frederiksbergense]|uniref:DNA-binding transcriptional LysR family regulator n=1 Tax=Mycolicibacterium frederiksbergense TaxID=117567 RepID=A0ABT6KTK5_9MYCO|nr:LysR substrate-binding domain-containing protein [Mycolicibacterium frederiksbergense]MDH6194053.1 DNA-binding transcriptional LysR family regulator [Mycolicibacterium frederiksbergense]